MFIKILKELEPCESCQTLRQQLEHERYQVRQLINHVLEITSPVKKEIIVEDTEVRVPLPNTRFANFHEKRKQLEEQSRVEANRLAQLKKDNEQSSEKVEGIEELESMVGI